MTRDVPNGVIKAQDGSIDLPLIGRRYRHVRFLGEGAQGAVHLVQDQHLGGRLLAAKMLRPQAGDDWRQAFRHEFEVLAGLNHPRLSKVHDFGATEDGRVFFTQLRGRLACLVDDTDNSRVGVNGLVFANRNDQDAGFRFRDVA